MDPLSEVLSLLDVRTARCTRLEAGGTWALRFPAKPALKFVAVMRGDCWIMLPHVSPTRLIEGDAFLLANAPSYVIANDRKTIPQDGIALFDWDHSDVARHGGDDTVLLAGSFSFGASDATLLLQALPAFIRIPANESASRTLRGTLELLDQEIRTDRMGASLVTRRLADVLLVQALRAYVAMTGSENNGWIGALADPKIGTVLRLLHGDVARNWKVDELARAAGMSRSAFAFRFKTLVGTPPLDYLVRWRMQLARDFLRRNDTVASVAFRLGYRSESAFGNAFKRVYGRSPKRYWAIEADACGDLAGV